ncbi:MAG: hypothetical protein R3304_12305 [Longimicrobiales bacterium]|nr:hypothetical protein [Longimicrobiales bacterium]
MRSRLFALGTALALGLITAGCASTPSGSDGAEDTRIQVENNHPLLVNVEAVAGGVDYRLGQVETADTQVFTLPDNVDSTYDLHLRVDPVGSAAVYVSDEILYTVGDLIRVQVESNLNVTTVTVR